jgi:hypothetical protein
MKKTSLQVALRGIKARMGRIARMGKVALTGAAVVAAIPLASSCGDDEDDNFYAPPANLDEAGIVQLVKDANAAFAEEQKYTITDIGSGVEDGLVFTARGERQVDKVNKKYLYIVSINNKVIDFLYVENGKKYDFFWGFTSVDDFTQGKGEKHYTLEDLDAEDLYGYFGNSGLINLLEDLGYTWTWKVAGTALVGTRTYIGTSYSSTYILEIRLDTDKRFKSINVTSIYIKDGITETQVSTETIAYNANPSFPSGFNKADFKPQSSSYESSASLRAKWEAITGIGGTHRAMLP